MASTSGFCRKPREGNRRGSNGWRVRMLPDAVRWGIPFFGDGPIARLSLTDEEDAVSNTVAAGSHCRQAARVAIEAFVVLLEEASTDGTVTIADARRIARATLAADGPLSEHYERAEEACHAAFELAGVERKRTDFLGRLVVSTFSGLFADPTSGISRERLPQFFKALTMMLGEEIYDEFQAECTVVLNNCRRPDGLVDWDRYAVAPEALDILNQALGLIAVSFQRFETRKDWFLVVMNKGDRERADDVDGPKAFFDARAFRRLFRAMFASVRPETMDEARRQAYMARYGLAPEEVFGPLLAELDALPE